MMFKFISAIFGGPGRRPASRAGARRALQVRLGLNELSHRIVPSGCSTGMAGAHRAEASSSDGESAASIVRTARLDSASDAQSSGSNAQQGCHAEVRVTLIAVLSNASGATGTAKVGQDSSTLTINVQGAAADASLDVAVDGNSVGTLTTDSTGAGTATISDADILAGSVITVGDLQGTFTKSRLTSTLAGETDASARAVFDVEAVRLHVGLRGGAASTTYDVSVDGTVVGQITTNESGAGKLTASLTSAIKAGSTIAIIDSTSGETLLSGAFA